MDAPTAKCANPEHAGFEGNGACPQCYAAVCAELGVLQAILHRVSDERNEAWRKVRDAEEEGRLPVNPYGLPKPVITAGGFELVHGTDALSVHPRSRTGGKRPSWGTEDSIVVTCQHRTTGASRSILMGRPLAVTFHRWLGEWIEQGWPGVPRRCGELYRPDNLHLWECDQEPEHREDHEGPATGWSSADGGRPGRRSWERAAA